MTLEEEIRARETAARTQQQDAESIRAAQAAELRRILTPMIPEIVRACRERSKKFDTSKFVDVYSDPTGWRKKRQKQTHRIWWVALRYPGRTPQF